MCIVKALLSAKLFPQPGTGLQTKGQPPARGSKETSEPTIDVVSRWYVVVDAAKNHSDSLSPSFH